MGLTSTLFSTSTGQALTVCAFGGFLGAAYLSRRRHINNNNNNNNNNIGSDNYIKPISVNYHFTRECNKSCGFCFHVAKTSHIATPAEMERGLRLLADAGMRKINFAGGEPFLYPDGLGALVRFCKVDLGLESVSIISNGTLIRERWMQQFGKYVDVLGVSCDSFDEEMNKAIGRGTGKNVKTLFQVRGWCEERGIKFKLNTVVCRFNWREDMVAVVKELRPFRWKCFQVLVVGGENDATSEEMERDGGKKKRDATKFVVSDEEFGEFCKKLEGVEGFVPEGNDVMASSYLLLDEYLCFLDKGSGKEKQSSCILNVGVQKALNEVRWDQEAFLKRGGLYDWTKGVEGVGGRGRGCGREASDNLQW